MGPEADSQQEVLELKIVQHSAPMQGAAPRVREPCHRLVVEVGIPPLRKERDTNYLTDEGHTDRLSPLFFFFSYVEYGGCSLHTGSPTGENTCSFVASITRAVTTARGSTGSARMFPAMPRKVDPRVPGNFGRRQFCQMSTQSGEIGSR